MTQRMQKPHKKSCDHEWRPDHVKQHDRIQKNNKESIASPINLPTKQMRLILGLTSLITMVIGLFLTSTMSEDQGLDEMMNRTSTSIESGFKLDEATDIDLDARDFEVGEFDGGSARMLIWDFTGDSEDKVQIIVDGQVLRESHTLTTSVAAYSVPVPSVVTIQGLDDNATYAVKFPERRYTIFNAVTPGASNAYTLTPGL